MGAYLIHVYTLLHLISLVDTIDCNIGWFGPQCRYRCHCAVSSTCNEYGACPNNEPCTTEFFGKGCQHVDGLSFQKRDTKQLYLYDSDDRTCNKQINAKYVEVLLEDKSSVFSFIRIAVNNASFVLNFTTKINNWMPCMNERKFLIDSKVVDVTCDNRIIMTTLLIEGPISPYICSIYVSYGRNLALRESTSQSAVSYAMSSAAVDGNTDRSFSHKSCSQTESSSEGAWWRINFTFPVVIQSFHIYNRNAYVYRLDGFTLKTFTSSYTLASSFTGGIDISVQNFHVQDEIPIIYALIKPSVINKRKLILCEVEAYGEYSCPQGMYGLYCNAKCACQTTEVCHVYTGACATACTPGFYGDRCSFRCSSRCLSQICEFKTGKCVKCNPGYTGETCANECPEHYYGELCRLKCSDNCVNKTCDTASGKCDKCVYRYVGDYCNVCPEKIAGPYCNVVCPTNCLNRTCDNITGECARCRYGFSGASCNERIHIFPYWVIIFATFAFIFIFVLCYEEYNNYEQGEILVSMNY